MQWIVCENLRSAYNVGNIFRTADALGRGVICSGYTARADHPQVKKTSLGAEESVPYKTFDTIEDAMTYIKDHGLVISAEITEKSLSLTDAHVLQTVKTSTESESDIFLIVGNEITGVEEYTLTQSDLIIHIPMQWHKESLNVGQAAAICMWELAKAKL